MGEGSAAMTDSLKKRVVESLAGLQQVVYGVQSKGGYKVRSRIMVPNQELDDFVDGCSLSLVKMLVTMIVAEDYIDSQLGSSRVKDMRDMVDIVMRELAETGAGDPKSSGELGSAYRGVVEGS
jgi:hypothetical protein